MLGQSYRPLLKSDTAIYNDTAIRPVSTQENSPQIGPDRKVADREVGGSQVQNCFKLGKELASKAHVRVKFCSDPVRSEDYFPEWKPAYTRSRSWSHA